MQPASAPERPPAPIASDDLPLDKEALKLSIQGLQRVYAFVIALAIGAALNALVIDPATKLPDLSRLVSSHAAIFGVFFATVVPFFHGMNRHLDDFYALGRMPKSPSGPVRIPRAGAVLLDLTVFVIEAGLLYVLALTLLDQAIFFLLLGSLLLIDVVWSFTTYLITGSPAIRWGIINLVAGPMLLVCRGLTQMTPGAHLILLVSIVLARTIVDYRVNWRFYFPSS